MPTYVELRPGLQVKVLPAGGTVDPPYQSTIRHVAPDVVRVDMPRRGDEAIDVAPEAQLMIVLDQHGRLYTFTTAVQRVDVATDTLLIDRPRIVERSERRQYFRLSVSLRPRYAAIVDQERVEVHRLEALILDLSGGGLRLRSKQAIEAGDRLHLVFLLGDELMDVDAEAMSVVHRPEETPWEYQVGARFVPLTRQLQERVIRYVFQQQVQYLKRGVA